MAVEVEFEGLSLKDALDLAILVEGEIEHQQLVEEQLDKLFPPSPADYVDPPRAL